jgi:hypothetical protein
VANDNESADADLDNGATVHGTRVDPKGVMEVKFIA